MLQTEITTIREDGYTSSLAGDFNGHIRADSHGKPVNNRDINSNGRLIRNFVSSNDLRIVNKDTERCKGLFTQITHNSVSALDLVLEDDKEDFLVTEMSIDTFGKILGGSDHSAIFYKLKIKPGSTTDELQEEEPVIGPNQATAEAYREAFEALVVLESHRYWTEMPWFLQDTLVGAVKIACNQRPQHKTHVTVCKSMRWIRKKCIVAEAQVSQLEHEKAILSFGNGEDKDKETVKLQFFKQDVKTHMQITEKVQQCHL